MSEDSELGVTVPGGSFSAKGYRMIDLIMLILVAAMIAGPIAGFYWHTSEMTSVLKMQTGIIVAIRYQTCINALPEAEKWRELQKGGYCEQIARIGFAP